MKLGEFVKLIGFLAEGRSINQLLPSLCLVVLRLMLQMVCFLCISPVQTNSFYNAGTEPHLCLEPLAHLVPFFPMLSETFLPVDDAFTRREIMLIVVRAYSRVC